MANLNPLVEVNHKEKQMTSGGLVAGLQLELDVIAISESMAKRRAKAYALRNYRTKPSDIMIGVADMVSDGYTIMEKIAGPTPVATYRVEVSV